MKQTGLAKRAMDRHVKALEKTALVPIVDSYAQYSFDPENECNLNTIAEKGIQSGFLNNFQKILDSELGQNITRSTAYGPYVNEVWPVVTAWYPDFPLKDLISVQDMDKPLAYLFFSSLLIGTDKPSSVYGDVVETATGPRKINGKYPTGEIVGELIVASDLSFDNTADTTAFLLAYAPLNISHNLDYLAKIKVAVTRSGGTTNYYAASVVGTTIQLGTKAGAVVTPVAGYTIDSHTGLVTIQEAGGASATTVISATVNYVWNLDFATVENIPSVREDIQMVPMEAQPRALSFDWTLFAEYLKKSQFGSDVRTENTKRILNLLYQFQVRYILDEMYDYAEGTPATINLTGGTTVSLDIKAQKAVQDLKLVANVIEIASGRMEGNRIVCGKTFKSFVESLPTTWFTPTVQSAESGFSGPREIGTFSSFKVYYDPIRTADQAFMTYRGSEWYDAAYYLGVFMPVVPTDAIALGVTVRQAFVAMEAYKYHKKNCVIPLTITQA